MSIFIQKVFKMHSGGEDSTFEMKSETGIIGSKPRQLPDNATRAQMLASCSHIIAVICDDCFEKKSHLFKGYEEDNSEKRKLRLVVE